MTTPDQEARIAALRALAPAHHDDVHSWQAFRSRNEWGLPELAPYRGPIPERWCTFPGVEPGAGTHFFVGDDRFECVWRRPFTYAKRVAGAAVVCSPDFSVWRDWPAPLLLWQTYRNRWTGALWQAAGIPVVATVGWTDGLDPMYWAGVPRRATVAVGSIGLKDRAGRLLFARGLAAMEEALESRRVIAYGGLRYARLERAELFEIPYEHWGHEWRRARRAGRPRRKYDVALASGRRGG